VIELCRELVSLVMFLFFAKKSYGQASCSVSLAAFAAEIRGRFLQRRFGDG